MSEIPKKPTVAQRLVRLALTEDRTMVDLAEKLGVSRQTVHLWNKGEGGMSKEHTVALLALVGMDEVDLAEATEEVLNLKLELAETKNQFWDTEEKLGEAELELKGFLNGETEREMSEVTLRFAELYDRLGAKAEEREEELEALKADNAVLLKRALRAEAVLDNYRNLGEDKANEV